MKLNKKTLLAVISLWFLFPTLSHGQEWSYEIEPYGLFTSINGDACIGRGPSTTVDVNFDDILEHLELAGMIHFEAHNDNGWGLSLDYGFMDLGADFTDTGGVSQISAFD